LSLIQFFVPGIPRTAGSKRSFIPKGWTRAIITDASGKAGKDWRGDVKRFALEAYQGQPIIGPLCLTLRFHMQRPKGHFRGGKNAHVLRDDAPVFHISKPDVLKMARAIEDALTGILWVDDSQVAVEQLEKVYSAKPGCSVTVDRILTRQDWTQPVAEQPALSLGKCVEVNV